MLVLHRCSKLNAHTRSMLRKSLLDPITNYRPIEISQWVVAEPESLLEAVDGVGGVG